MCTMSTFRLLVVYYPILSPFHIYTVLLRCGVGTCLFSTPPLHLFSLSLSMYIYNPFKLTIYVFIHLKLSLAQPTMHSLRQSLAEVCARTIHFSPNFIINEQQKPSPC